VIALASLLGFRIAISFHLDGIVSDKVIILERKLWSHHVAS